MITLKRKQFLESGSLALMGLLFPNQPQLQTSRHLASSVESGLQKNSRAKSGDLTLFLSGDVMTGRGIDQVLPHSVSPELKERYVSDARRYVELAIKKHGSIPEKVSYEYIWGDALDVLSRMEPDARIINLETSVTTSNEYWPGKGIHYRMHPKNTPLFSKAGVDICILGNNHILDFGHSGLRETLSSLQGEEIQTAGAGTDLEEASEPAVVNTESGRLLVFSYGSRTSGVPESWKAEKNKAGLNFLSGPSKQNADQIINTVRDYMEPEDRVVISIHWGSNWGYQIPSDQKEFAHRLIDAGVANVIHGYSSHHPKGIEVYEDRPIIYGAGDLINDYEGISGREQYRSNLSLMYFPKLNSSGELSSLKMWPMHIRSFQLSRASEEEANWLTDMLGRECEKLGSSVTLNPEGSLNLTWD